MQSRGQEREKKRRKDREEGGEGGGRVVNVAKYEYDSKALMEETELCMRGKEE